MATRTKQTANKTETLPETIPETLVEEPVKASQYIDPAVEEFFKYLHRGQEVPPCLVICVVRRMVHEQLREKGVTCHNQLNLFGEKDYQPPYEWQGSIFLRAEFDAACTALKFLTGIDARECYEERNFPDPHEMRMGEIYREINTWRKQRGTDGKA